MSLPCLSRANLSLKSISTRCFCYGISASRSQTISTFSSSSSSFSSSFSSLPNSFHPTSNPEIGSSSSLKFSSSSFLLSPTRFYSSSITSYPQIKHTQTHTRQTHAQTHGSHTQILTQSYTQIRTCTQTQSQTHTQGPGQQERTPKLSRAKIPGIKHVIAVASGKGGVGKSTTAGKTDLIGETMGLLSVFSFGLPLFMFPAYLKENLSNKRRK